MSKGVLLSSQPKKPFHNRNGSGELDVFEAAGYFSGANENLNGTRENISVEANTLSTNNSQTYSMRPIRRMSLDMLNHRGNPINPIQSMLIENPMNTKEKKFKQPSSPGGKLAHFLNSLFNQASSKKSKSKKKSTNDEDETPSGWKRKRRSSISYFRSGTTTTSSNTTTTTTTTVGTGTAIFTRDDKSSFSTSTSSGFTAPPPYHAAPIPTKNCKDPGSHSYLKPPPTQTTKIPVTENLNKIENFNTKSDYSEKKMSLQNGVVEKVKIFDEKQEDIKEFKKFVVDDDGADSDSSSDLFELANCDFGYCSGGLPVYKTIYTDNINRCAPISSS
ncbi:hypothetical protein QVD17_29302 [Tagetes erecta]|uniref:Protein BIG GRAIN 1-like E n=1 Tax=Tagetes erecta TaxID=13708 RepID=A0AAD8NSP9_TARER|nr:hypothetical protein QVD17_29302 [Tagetes erecta]